METHVSNTVVTIWIFSSVMSWATWSVMTSMGSGLPDGIRKMARSLAFAIATACLASTLLMWPIFGEIFKSINLSDTRGIAAFGFTIWAFAHLVGANISVYGFVWHTFKRTL